MVDLRDWDWRIARGTNESDVRLWAGSEARLRFEIGLPDDRGRVDPFPVALGTHEVVFVMRASLDEPPLIVRRLSTGEIERDLVDSSVVYVPLTTVDTDREPGEYIYAATLTELAVGGVGPVPINVGRVFLLPNAASLV